jgi:hypothetical protein
MIGTMVTDSGLPQIRTLGYCCQLIGGVLVEQCPNRSEVGRRLLVVSAQFNHCRTVLRLFDDLAMFVYTKQYGLGTKVMVNGAVGRGKLNFPRIKSSGFHGCFKGLLQSASYWVILLFVMVVLATELEPCTFYLSTLLLSYIYCPSVEDSRQGLCC